MHSKIIASRQFDFFGSLLTIAMPALVAIEPFLRESVDSKLPPASAAVIVAAFGGFITVASRLERRKNEADEAPPA